MGNKYETNYSDKAWTYLIGVIALVCLIYFQLKDGISDRIESKTMGGRKLDAITIALKRAGGETLVYTVYASLVLLLLFMSIRAFKKHYAQKKIK